jgi:lipopolysaccharide transport system permease protein
MSSLKNKLETQNPKPETGSWTLVIKPTTGWFDIDLRDLWRYQDLVLLFVRRNFVSFYKQTVLGPLWFFIQPVLTTVMFTVVFSGIAKIPTDGLPPALFYLAGTVMWNYFAECLNKTSTTFIDNAAIFGKVYFPRLVMPISVVLTNLITFGIQFLLFLGFLGYFAVKGSVIHPNAHILLTPVLILLMAALGLGLGIIVSSLTTKYRDLRFLVSFGVQLAMYATPIVYPLSSAPDRFKPVLLANPMTAIVETFRYGFLGTGSFSWAQLGCSAASIAVILALGVVLFSRVEKTFMDTV